MTVTIEKRMWGDAKQWKFVHLNVKKEEEVDRIHSVYRGTVWVTWWRMNLTILGIRTCLGNKNENFFC